MATRSDLSMSNFYSLSHIWNALRNIPLNNHSTEPTGSTIQKLADAILNAKTPLHTPSATPVSQIIATTIKSINLKGYSNDLMCLRIFFGAMNKAMASLESQEKMECIKTLVIDRTQIMKSLTKIALLANEDLTEGNQRVRFEDALESDYLKSEFMLFVKDVVAESENVDFASRLIEFFRSNDFSLVDVKAYISIIITEVYESLSKPFNMLIESQDMNKFLAQAPTASVFHSQIKMLEDTVKSGYDFMQEKLQQDLPANEVYYDDSEDESQGEIAANEFIGRAYTFAKESGVTISTSVEQEDVDWSSAVEEDLWENTYSEADKEANPFGDYSTYYYKTISDFADEPSMKIDFLNLGGILLRLTKITAERFTDIGSTFTGNAEVLAQKFDEISISLRSIIAKWPNLIKPKETYEDFSKDYPTPAALKNLIPHLQNECEEIVTRLSNDQVVYSTLDLNRIVRPSFDRFVALLGRPDIKLQIESDTSYDIHYAKYLDEQLNRGNCNYRRAVSWPKI